MTLRLHDADRAEPPPPRLSYYLVRLNGDRPVEQHHASSVIEAVAQVTDLLAVAQAGSTIHMYVNAVPVTLAEIDAAMLAGDCAQARELLHAYAAQR
jgi:hypothetical protein